MTNKEHLDAIEAKLVELKDLVSHSLNLRAVGGSHIANELLTLIKQVEVAKADAAPEEEEVVPEEEEEVVPPEEEEEPPEDPVEEE